MACIATTYPAWEFRANLKAGLLVEGVSVRKSTERMVTRLQRSSTDAKSLGEVLRKLSKQPRVTQLQVFQRLLDQQDRDLALPVYDSLRRQHWYKWSPNLHAQLAALLADKDQSEGRLLVLQTPEDLGIGQEMDLQVCSLLSYGKRGHLAKALAIFHDMQSHSSSRARDLSYRALIQVYTCLDQPDEAYLVLQQMKSSGCVPILDDYKAILYKFGTKGHLAEMDSLASELQRDGFQLDPSAFNMKLSAYAQAMKSESVRETLETMRSLCIPLSVNSYNAISKSCPALTSALKSLKELPLSEKSLLESFDFKSMSSAELQLVRQLLTLGIPSNSIKWEESTWELDLHQMFLGTAFLALWLWLLQLKTRCNKGRKLPISVKIVTGWGKHSGPNRKPLLSQNVLKLLDRLQSPFTVDKQNRGLLSCQGSAVRLWLLKLIGN